MPKAKREKRKKEPEHMMEIELRKLAKPGDACLICRVDETGEYAAITYTDGHAPNHATGKGTGLTKVATLVFDQGTGKGRVDRWFYH